MIVVMKKGASAEQVAHMVARVEEFGLRAHVIQGTERTVIAAIGEKRDEHRQSLETGPGVAEVVPILAPYKVASIEVKPERTIVRVGPFSAGNCHLGVIAGPCSVESENQTLVTGGGQGGRGHGTAGRCVQAPNQSLQFPRTQRGGPQDPGCGARRDGAAGGHGSTRRSRRRTHRPICRRAPDRRANMQNYNLLEEAGATGKPVLLKRGASATLEELLLAAEYILNVGNQNVILCERGIRTFESHVRFTLPLASIPWLHQHTHLPVIVDPSHGTGHTSLVPSMAAAAVAAGADGLMLEVHPDPEQALSDGYQSLDLEQFAQTMQLCHRVADAVGKVISRLNDKDGGP